MSIPARQLDDIDREAIAEGQAMQRAFFSVASGRDSRRERLSNESDRTQTKRLRVSDQVLREREKFNDAK